MALQIWLPLTGDLHNQGLADLDITLVSGNELINTDGKIGAGALKLTKRQIISTTLFNGKKIFSWAFWVKVNEAWSANWLDGIYWITTDGNDTFANRQEFYTNCTKVGMWCASTSLSGYNFTPGVWTPLAGCVNYNTGDMAFYINGVLQNERHDVNTTWSITSVYLGDSGIDISECDVRLYDHYLSNKEVEEIAKGLVLHYKLDDTCINPNPNIITNSLFINNYNPWFSVNSSTLSVTTIEGKRVLTATKGTTDSLFGYSIEGYVAGTQQTYSFSTYIYAPSAMTWAVGTMLSTTEVSGWQTMVTSKNYSTQQLSEGWNYVTMTFTCSQASYSGKIQVYFTCPNGTTYYLYHPKIEQGNVVTRYIPNISESSFESNNIVYDSSGYNNNGSITGNLIINNNTPKYNSSIYFNGSSYILTDNSSFAWFDFNQCTIAGWMKPTTTPSSYSGSFGIAHNSIDGYYAKCFSICNSNGNFKINAAKGSTWIFIDTGQNAIINEWHHYVAVLDGTTVKAYIDGILVYTTTIDWGTATTASDTRVQIAVDLPGSDEIYQGYYSDIRIYTTALTEEQVLDLYYTSATIDNLGNVYSREYIETEKTSITKTGQFQIDKIHDSNDLTKASILKNENQIQGFTIYEY